MRRETKTKIIFQEAYQGEGDKVVMTIKGG